VLPGPAARCSATQIEPEMRQSLLPPIPHLHLAAKLLDAAADALLKGHHDEARSLVLQSDIPEIGTYSKRLLATMTVEVHRQVRRPKCRSKAERDPARMPTKKEQVAIFCRDGWRCRFCGAMVICKSARSVLTRTFPSETRWLGPEFQRHSALYALASSLDHIVPHSRGGKHEYSNFITACYCCQFGRGEWTLEESQLLDPRDRPPIVDSWDGLRRLVGTSSVRQSL
jgi:5-methylcytosine-specific restriction endonuclease McrA